MTPLFPDVDWMPVRRAVDQASRILLTTHRNPDGDGIGSQIALYHGLRALGKDVCMHNRDGVPRIYRFLPGSEQVGAGEAVDAAGVDLVISLDSGNLRRLGLPDSLFEKAATLVNIDHHAGNTRYGDIHVVEPRYCATGAMVFDLLLALGLAIEPPMAQAIYTAVLTDTSSFRLATVDAAVHRLAASLIECGAEPWPISMEVYESHSLASMRLLAACLETLELRDGGRSAWITVTQEMYRTTGADVEDTEGLIDYARSIAGVEVAVFIRADESGPSCWKVSFRGKCHADVGALAASLGGGGHPHAAGCLLRGSLDQVRMRLHAAVHELLAVER